MALSVLSLGEVTPRGGPDTTSVVVTGTGFGITKGSIIFDPLGANGGPYYVQTAHIALWQDDRIEYVVPSGFSLPDRDNRFYDVFIQRTAGDDGVVHPWWVPDSSLPIGPPPSSKGLDYQWPGFEAGTASQDGDQPRLWQAADFNRHLDRTLALEAAVGSSGGSGGWIMVRDISPTASGAVGSKTFQTAEGAVLQSAVSDTLNLDVTVNATGPRAKVNGVTVDLTKIAGESYYEGTASVVLAGSGNVTAIQVMPDDSNGSIAVCAITFQPGPTILTCQFAGGYPGLQTELKAGDTFQLQGTTDTPADLIEVQNYGAFVFSSNPVVAGTSFSATGTVADRGVVVQSLPARVRARNASLAFGATFDTDAAGTVDGVNRVQLNNVYPSFVDNGTTFPGAQTAFKGLEAGSQNTEVFDFDTLVYSSPHGDFSIGSPTTYVADKSLTCTAPGDYNDSATNYRIVATRVANGTASTFNKTIEVADVAPSVVVTQPVGRLRSGGNAGTAAQSYLITATSDQNLASAPDIAIPVGGTWLGGGFVGGPKVWTRTIQIHDNDAKGTSAWTYAVVPTNNAGLAAPIAGNQVNGGFVFRTMTVAGWPNREAAIGTQVADTAKLECSNLSKGPSGTLNYTYSPTTADVVNEYTITQPTGVANPTGDLWYNKDLANALSNTLGFQQIELEEAA